MSSALLLESAKATSILLASEVRLPREDVGAAFESIGAAEKGYEVLYTVTVVDSRDWRRVFLCHNATEATKVRDSFEEAQFDVYALRKHNDAKKFEPRRSVPLLVPSSAVVQREYRVVTREEAASRVEGKSGAQESMKTANASPNCSEKQMTRDATPQEKPKTVNNVSVGNKLPPPPPPTPTMPSQESRRSPIRNSQALLKPPLSGTKHTRSADNTKKQSEANFKKPCVRNKKNEKFEETRSLMKLAKASAKNKIGSDSSRNSGPTTNNTTTTVAYGSILQNLLDKDEEKGDHCSNSSSSSGSGVSFGRRNEEIMDEELPTLDVAVSSRENDDIILCDDAPPMVFCTPEPVTGTLKKEQQQIQHNQRRHESLGSAAQPKLTGFFQRDVIEYQKQYMREVMTDTVFENGEYFCKDKVCFRHKETKEVISEEEFYRRSADIMRSVRSDSQNVNSNDRGTTGQGSPSTPAGSVKPVSAEAARSSRPPKIEKQLRSQPKTLFSYFKTTSS
ncbi:hypothetical protein MOQ_002456 [Trypanosoma cruzi marinkellei]|uniref:Uncharacterized protein n=1 Tax=Trypanosoma cruzi marinkellei TaxID=85056 RepID=K2NXU5_TRYCR|nr:hypothetical protein MOQ_002456 [Trypanosoma cruzi marinkellei]